MDFQNLSDEPYLIMLGCFDTKGEDFEYLYTCLIEEGANILTINTGTAAIEVTFPIDISANLVALESNNKLADLQNYPERSHVIDAMGRGAESLLSKLRSRIKICGVIGMGGGGGTYLTLQAMQSIPFGIPKVCVSTVATKDLSRQIGAKDIVLIPSIVDIAGLNSISRVLLNQAATALVAMSNVGMSSHSKSKKTIAISMFGNTTECVKNCSQMLRDKGYEVMCFHAVGAGGRTMEALIDEGLIDGVIDITTTELADELCGGICSAGPNRLEAASRMGIPQIVVPGCLDMVNFAQKDTVPKKYSERLLYSWSPDVTLMRTNKAENIELGKIVAHKLNQSKGNVTILLPLKGISIVSTEGQVFHNPEFDQALFATIKSSVNSEIAVVEVDQHINDKVFSVLAVDKLLELLNQ